MDAHASLIDTPPHPPASYRTAWHAIAVLAATAVSWLVFSTYRQPDLILRLADLRLC
jgi:hypothetical protein